LKEEIQRVLELEAENAVLQESLATLPQLPHPIPLNLKSDSESIEEKQDVN
jgi:hypothetical protein